MTILSRSAAAICVLLTLAAVPGCMGFSGQTGPVRFLADEDVVQFAGMHANAGTTVVFGLATVRNDGDDVATLEAGSLVGDVPPDAARMVEVRVRDANGPGDGVAAGCWPFENLERQSIPLQGYTLPPRREADLLFVVSVEQTGRWYWPTTQLRYTVEGEVHEASTSLGFQVSPTKTNWCAVPTGDGRASNGEPAL